MVSLSRNGKAAFFGESSTVSRKTICNLTFAKEFWVRNGTWSCHQGTLCRFDQFHCLDIFSDSQENLHTAFKECLGGKLMNEPRSKPYYHHQSSHKKSAKWSNIWKVNQELFFWKSQKDSSVTNPKTSFSCCQKHFGVKQLQRKFLEFICQVWAQSRVSHIAILGWVTVAS